MRKIIYVLSIVLIAIFSVSAQTAAPEKVEVKKVEVKAKAVTETIEREKFDPKRNAAADLQTAILQAQAADKRIILDVGGEWCIWCRWMDEYFIKNGDLLKLRDENFVWLKINMSEENENAEFLSKYPKIEGYPHLFVLEKDGSLLYSQSTAELEEGKSYNKQKMADFLTKWSPVKEPKKAEIK